jgi:hypothetical protein
MIDGKNMDDHEITEIWGKVESHTNGALDGILYHCSTPNGNFDFWTDAQGKVTDVTPSVIEPKSN